MLEAFGNGYKILTVKETMFLTGDSVYAIALVAAFNVLLVHAIVTNWKRRYGLEALVVILVVAILVTLEITGVHGAKEIATVGR